MNNDKVTPKKRLGQHFLKDERIAKRIVESINSSNKNVLEIGPGMGVLTKYLIENKTVNLSVIEIDKESVSYLQCHFPELASRILAQNFLTLDLEAYYQEPVTVIGNFPYNISSQILFKLLEYKNLSTQLVGMFQKEVADRIASKPGSKQYGILSVLIQAFFDVEYLFTVESNLFFPPPKVKSAVIRITRNFEKKLHCDETLFKNVIKAAFNQRRKTLRNSLKTFTFEEKYLADPIFNKRPEQLSVEEFELITCWI
ncbi:MAG: 16S rRNA (adenine(1518)-N(6)/adenine(1519)-N(6))-dimethyltransferase RsmA [Bacteroidales bacterium]|jgi:16S rRNA (adenine1518-N6/adenine1519-N6)-dimethyltransferase|nr:16S rRNA (adenine(1518)-N(6)/adenine(1519)-N(6))-dimethyltransferase RsmA [Bacteroidales bacterium]